jgi:transaldolase
MYRDQGGGRAKSGLRQMTIVTLAIEQSVLARVPINVTLLFSPQQYVAAADAYIKRLERRVEARLLPDIQSLASLFISCWNRAVADIVRATLRNRLGVAVGRITTRPIAINSVTTLAAACQSRRTGATAVVRKHGDHGRERARHFLCRRPRCT